MTSPARLFSRGSYLEATRIAAVLRRETVGGVLHTPPVETGIQAGTTHAPLYARAVEDGWPTAVTPGTVADLHAADAVWLLSGIRGAATVTALDGRSRGDGDLSPRVRELLSR